MHDPGLLTVYPRPGGNRMPNRRETIPNVHLTQFPESVDEFDGTSGHSGVYLTSLALSGERMIRPFAGFFVVFGLRPDIFSGRLAPVRWTTAVYLGGLGRYEERPGSIHPAERKARRMRRATISTSSAMTSPRGEERSKRSGLSQEKITLSLPAEFFRVVSDEFEHALRLLDSQQAVLREAGVAEQQEDKSTECPADAASAAEYDPVESSNGDRLNRLVRELLGKDLDALDVEQDESPRRLYSVASSELYHAAELLGLQARHRLARLAVAFDQIAGDPVRRELARRRVEDSAERKRNENG